MEAERRQAPVNYHYYVDIDATDGKHKHRVAYNGTDAADAMAAWSKAVSDGAEYAVLEALREIRVTTPGQNPADTADAA